jgi:hypothetical protein
MKGSNNASLYSVMGVAARKFSGPHLFHLLYDQINSLVQSLENIPRALTIISSALFFSFSHKYGKSSPLQLTFPAVPSPPCRGKPNLDT